MHTTWRAPVAWLLCFSARFVVLDTLLSFSLAPTIASSLYSFSLFPSIVYIHIRSISLLLALDRFESFSLLPLEVLRSSVALTLSLFSLALLLPLSLSLSLSLLEVLQPRYLFSSRSPERCPLGGKERAEKYALFAGLSIVLSLFPATTSLDVQLPGVVLSRTLLSLPLSFGL